MLVISPLITFVALILTIRVLGKTWSASFLIASLVWGSVVIGITELLNLAKQITPLSVSFAWSVITGASVFGFYAIKG
ncbi:MAG TPA: hypothetical protein V6C69_11320, partial [Trichormus sp.]